LFTQLFQLLLPVGMLVTYCSKSYVRKNMLAAGFTVEKIPGPPRKREMLRATKPHAAI
jgi:tRNA U34 5-methylaminomethyl-2-thiouridine-forming methyltransferase MnmC